MKFFKFLSLALTIGILASSCGEESIAEQLEGTWTLVSIDGETSFTTSIEVAGQTITSTGDGTIAGQDLNSTLIIRTDGTATSTGSATMVQSLTLDTGEVVEESNDLDMSGESGWALDIDNQITFDGEPTELDGNRLTIEFSENSGPGDLDGLPIPIGFDIDISARFVYEKQ